jgi:hypothetical protein
MLIKTFLLILIALSSNFSFASSLCPAHYPIWCFGSHLCVAEVRHCSSTGSGDNLNWGALAYTDSSAQDEELLSIKSEDNLSSSEQDAQIEVGNFLRGDARDTDTLSREALEIIAQDYFKLINESRQE